MITKRITFSTTTELKKSLFRPTFKTEDLLNKIAEIYNAIVEFGDAKLIEYTKKFDGVSLNSSEIELDLATTVATIDPLLEKAIKVAYENIYNFHKAQIKEDLTLETQPGVTCYRKSKAIEKVGLYIPGGSAPLFSTVLMLAIPAKIAGCKEVILCTPPNKNGEIHPAIIFTAKLCGIKKIYKAGGAQAICAMAVGTETIPKVYKIFGPGNQYVTAAKQYVSLMGVGIDLPAGPSELMVVANSNRNPAFIAADLLSQAEHGTDSQVVIVSDSITLLNKINLEISLQLNSLPRKDIAEKALSYAVEIIVKTDDEAIEVINEYAPEHLILMVNNENKYIENINNAGSIFIGDYTPESAGDYASGTNHTLPTSGFAKQYSGVSLDSFIKNITYQKITKEGLKDLGVHIEIMAENEGLMAHKNAVSFRLESLKKEVDL